MSRKIYIATGLDNMPEYKEVCTLFRNAGFEITYDWSTTGDMRRADEDIKALVAKKEFEAVQKAEGLVILSPGKRGTHTEFGVALAGDKPVVLYHGSSEDLDVIFYSLRNVHKFDRKHGYIKLIEFTQKVFNSWVKNSPIHV